MCKKMVIIFGRFRLKT